MQSHIVYEAVSRVVCDNNVIGFMVRPVGKKSEDIYMSLDVISFGLSQNTFEIKDVKLVSSGKPHGCNGFLLSKLPVVDLIDSKAVNKNLYRVLLYVIKELGVSENLNKFVKFTESGIYSNCSVSLRLFEYSDIENEIANKELNKTLKFYFKHLPKELKSFCDKIVGTVEENGNIIITVSKSLVKEVK